MRKSNGQDTHRFHELATNMCTLHACMHCPIATRHGVGRLCCSVKLVCACTTSWGHTLLRKRSSVRWLGRYLRNRWSWGPLPARLMLLRLKIRSGPLPCRYLRAYWRIRSGTRARLSRQALSRRGTGACRDQRGRRDTRRGTPAARWDCQQKLPQPHRIRLDQDNRRMDHCGTPRARGRRRALGNFQPSPKFPHAHDLPLALPKNAHARDLEAFQLKKTHCAPTRHDRPSGHAAQL